MDMINSSDMVVVARMLHGDLVGYFVPPDYRQDVWKWLNSLSCVVNVWEEHLETYRHRRASYGPASGNN